MLFGRLDGFCFIYPGAYLSHTYGIRAGRNLHVNGGAFFDGRGGLTIGSNVLVGPNAVLLSSSTTGRTRRCRSCCRATGSPRRRSATTCGSARTSFVTPGVTIANGTAIGAGSVVTGDTVPYTIVAGVPARHIGDWRARGERRRAHRGRGSRSRPASRSPSSSPARRGCASRRSTTACRCSAAGPTSWRSSRRRARSRRRLQPRFFVYPNFYFYLTYAWINALLAVRRLVEATPDYATLLATDLPRLILYGRRSRRRPARRASPSRTRSRGAPAARRSRSSRPARRRELPARPRLARA